MGDNLMKRLIILGIPCASQAWLKLFPVSCTEEQIILPFIELFSKNFNKNKKLTDLVPDVVETILTFKPDQIVMHDLGVTLGILALINARKINCELKPNVIIFNGAFKGFDVEKSPHPLRIQSMTYDTFLKEVFDHGGEVDERYQDHFTSIQLLYQQIIMVSKKEKIEYNQKSILQEKAVLYNAVIDLGGEVLLIASRNDPYIHFECLELLEKTIANSHLTEIPYGHFPYAGDRQLITRTIVEFQNSCQSRIRARL